MHETFDTKFKNNYHYLPLNYYIFLVLKTNIKE